MQNNRSVPANIILPHIHYKELERAIAWLHDAFGFREHFRYGDPPSGAQLGLGDAWIMVRRSAENEATPAQLGYGTQSVTIFVEDVESRCEKARGTGAQIVEEPHETIYGEFQFAVLDLEGHHWVFARHGRDVAPQDWGAQLAQG